MEKENFTDIMNIVEDWLPRDASIAIAVDNHYTHYMAGKHDIQLREGQKVEDGSVAEKILLHKRKTSALMEQSFSGIPYYCIGYPVQIKNKPGALIVILPPNYQTKKNESPLFLTGKKEDVWFPVPIEDITYIESLQKKTWFYTEDDGYHSSHTLKSLEDELPSTFIRVHRSYIVNINFIHHLSRDVTSNLLLTLKNGATLPVSQTYMHHVRTTLGF